MKPKSVTNRLAGKSSQRTFHDLVERIKRRVQGTINPPVSKLSDFTIRKNLLLNPKLAQVRKNRRSVALKTHSTSEMLNENLKFSENEARFDKTSLS